MFWIVSRLSCFCDCFVLLSFLFFRCVLCCCLVVVVYHIVIVVCCYYVTLFGCFVCLCILGVLFVLFCFDVVFWFFGSVFVVLLCVESCLIFLIVFWIDMCRVLLLFFRGVFVCFVCLCSFWVCSFCYVMIWCCVVVCWPLLFYCVLVGCSWSLRLLLLCITRHVLYVVLSIVVDLFCLRLYLGGCY